jgi:hypothetical protein
MEQGSTITPYNLGFRIFLFCTRNRSNKELPLVIIITGFRIFSGPPLLCTQSFIKEVVSWTNLEINPLPGEFSILIIKSGKSLCDWTLFKYLVLSIS